MLWVWWVAWVGVKILRPANGNDQNLLKVMQGHGRLGGSFCLSRGKVSDSYSSNLWGGVGIVNLRNRPTRW